MAATRLKAPYRRFVLRWQAPAGGSVVVRTQVRSGPHILARSKPRLLRFASVPTAPSGDVISVPTVPSTPAAPVGATPPAGSTPAPALLTPPVATAPPSISGAAQQDLTLTANPGTWTGSQPIAFAYRWQRCNSTGGACTTIAGATASTYTVVSADVTNTLRVAVTATNSAGAATATSAATAVVTRKPANTVLPRISGTARDGQRLTASAGTWTGTQPITFAYQWQSCNTAGGACAPIAGATSTSYTLKPGDVGTTLRVAVTATNSAGTAIATSSPTSTVAAIPPPGGAAVALWHMDETSGTTMVDSAGGHNGTTHSGVRLGQPGFIGTAFGFSGSSYVSVPSAADLNPGSLNLTVTIHLKTTEVPPPEDWDLIRKGLNTSVGGQWKVEYYPSAQGSCGFQGASGAASELTAGPRLDDGAWHTITCIKRASSIETVIDGQVFSKGASIGSIDNTDDVVIGARPGSEFFQGSLDEASIRIG